MTDWGIRKNGSNYYDPTAYKAITNADDSNKPKPGEIWTLYNEKKTKYEQMLVVQVNDTVCNFLRLQTDKAHEKCIPVHSTCIMYTDCRMLSWCFWTANKMQFIKKLTTQEFDEILDEIEDYFGIDTGRNEAVKEAEPVDNARQAEPEMLKLLNILKKENEDLKERIEILKDQAENHYKHSIQSSAFADAYKQMYTELLERTIRHDSKVHEL